MIKENYEKIKAQAGNSTVIVVTKYHSIEDTLKAYNAGVRHFGENRVEGFLSKVEALPNDATVHYIGTLQSRKVKEIVHHLHVLHALDRESIAKKIEQYSSHRVKCFVQVNISGEESKHGIRVDEIEEFLNRLKQYSKVEVIGFMTMAPHTNSAEEINDVFSTLKALRDDYRLKNEGNIQIESLSMGMSNDYEIALQNDADYIRIGSKIMGTE